MRQRIDAQTAVWLAATLPVVPDDVPPAWVHEDNDVKWLRRDHSYNYIPVRGADEHVYIGYSRHNSRAPTQATDAVAAPAGLTVGSSTPGDGAVNTMEYGVGIASEETGRSVPGETAVIRPFLMYAGVLSNTYCAMSIAEMHTYFSGISAR